MDRLADVNKSRKAFAFTHAGRPSREHALFRRPYHSVIQLGRISPMAWGSKDKNSSRLAPQPRVLASHSGNFSHAGGGPLLTTGDEPSGCAREPFAVRIGNLFRLGIRDYLAPEGRPLMAAPAFQNAASPSNTMKAPGGREPLAVVR